MLRQLISDFWLAAVGTAVILVAAVAYPAWQNAIRTNAQRATAEPFRIAGDLYYVGTNDVTSFLLTGPKGHVLIDGAHPEQVGMIDTSIRQLGFDIKDVAVIISTDPGLEHAGTLAALQKASNAELWATDADAGILAAGGIGAPHGPATVLTYLPPFHYEAPRVDHRVTDGETVRLGPIALTAHVMPGCTAWTFVVRDAGRDLHVVHRCNLELPPAIPLVDPDPASPLRTNYERTLRMLRSLPVDIWITGHAREWGRYRKFSARAADGDPVAPFIDRDGYLRTLDDAQASFRARVAEK